MSFRFRFTNLLHLREQERNQVAVRLAEINAAIADLSQQRNAIAADRASLRERRLAVRSGVISASTLKSHDDYDAALVATDHELAGQELRLHEQHDACHRQLIAAQQEVAKIEKLQQLDSASHQTQLARREAQQQDSIITSSRQKTLAPFSVRLCAQRRAGDEGSGDPELPP